jgi:serine/threonine-protein kinase
MPPPEAVRAALERLLASREFAHSVRLARFLRFAVEETIAGRGAQLKECVIGVEVFDRDASYDSRLDPIVRVEARRLRTKLGKYYRGAGVAEPVQIEFPKGGYTPVFQMRDARAGAETIAVAPFVILSRADPENESFGGGLTEELIHALTRVQGLRVVAWRQDWDPAAAVLPIGRLLEGSVRRFGGTLRVTARLVNPTDRSVLWSQVYERGMEDCFAVQDEIAKAIAGLCHNQLDSGGAGYDKPPRSRPEPSRLCARGVRRRGPRSRSGAGGQAAARALGAGLQDFLADP